MKNLYEIRGDVTAIFLNWKGELIEALISTKDLEKAKEFPNTWLPHRQHKDQYLYVRGMLPRTWNEGKQKQINLHRFILDVPDDMVVDHINHDTLNNTRENLRIVTNAENGQNRVVKHHSRTGIRGVHIKDRKFSVEMQVKKKKYFFGQYDTIEEAKRVAENARTKLMPYSLEGTKNAKLG